MTNDDIAYLRLLADWHDRQARYLLLTVPANIFHTGLPAPLSVIQARYVRLVASVLVVLDRTFDDAEELREFSLRYLAGFANFGKPLADAEIHSRGSVVRSSFPRGRACARSKGAVSAVAFLSCRLYGRKKFSQQPMPDR